MAQHDANIANQNFPSFRADLNNALLAIGSSQSGATAPTVTFTGMLWFDTTNRLLRIRNAANTDWVTLFDLNVTGGTGGIQGVAQLPDGSQAAPAIRFVNDADTGLFRLGENVIGVSAGGQAVSGGGLALRIEFAQVRTMNQHRAGSFLTDTQYLAPDDSPAAPAYSWANDANSGLYKIGADRIGMAIGGVLAMEFAANLVMSYKPFRVPAGTVDTPGLTIGSGNTGIFRNGNDLIAVVNGQQLAQLSPNFITALSGKAFAGDGNGLVNLATLAVLTSIAGAGLGARGTYALLGRSAGTTGFAAGTTYSGSALAYAGLSPSGPVISAVQPSGTWMAVCQLANGYNNPCGLFLRV